MIKVLGFNIRPEIEKPIYWIHLVILAVSTLGILQILFGGDMLTIKNVLVSIPILAAGDIIAHTVLGIN